MPQAWFAHFYAIGLAACAALVLLSPCILPAVGPKCPGAAAFCTSAYMCVLLHTCERHAWTLGCRNVPMPCISNLHPTMVQPAMACIALQEAAVAQLALTLFLAHLARRLLETLCIMAYPRGARMHVIAYAFGMSYYLVAPLSLMPDSVFTDQLPNSIGLSTTATTSSGSNAGSSVWATMSSAAGGVGAGLVAELSRCASLLPEATSHALAAATGKHPVRVPLVSRAWWSQAAAYYK